jgi:DNA-binding Xre family transcriptional regulator
MANSEPTSNQISEAKLVQAVKLDENSILIIKQLEDKNINLEALFVPGRYDPFNN